MLVPCAQLRVFAPLEAFPPAERDRLAADLEAGKGLSRSEAVALESAWTAAALISRRLPPFPQGALVRRVGQRTLFCPLDLGPRVALALDAFRRSVPPVVRGAFDPAGALERAVRTGRAPHVLDAPLTIPLHWFLAFAPGERHLTDPPEGAGPRLVHLTTVSQAQERLERVLEVLERVAEAAGDVLSAVEDLSAWLDAFDPTALLELDHGGIARLVPAAALKADRTCEELWRAIDAVAAEDMFTAAAAYGAVRARWSLHRARRRAS